MSSKTWDRQIRNLLFQFFCFDYMECCTLLMYWPQIFKVLVLKMLIMLLGTITLKTSFWIYNIYFVYRKSDSIILKCQMIHVSHYSSSLIFFRIEIQHVRSLYVLQQIFFVWAKRYWTYMRSIKTSLSYEHEF